MKRSDGPLAAVLTSLIINTVLGGASWSRSDAIVFAPDPESGLFTVPASGGAVTSATVLDRARQEMSHRWPSFLPDGVHFIFVVRGRATRETGVYVGSLASDRSVPIHEPDQPSVHPIYNATDVPPGFLFFARHDGVWIQPFDTRRLMALGRREQFTTAVAWAGTNRGAFSIGANTFVYASATAQTLDADAARERLGRDDVVSGPEPARPGTSAVSAPVHIVRDWKAAFIDRRQ
jgi:hypothetical protein